MSSHPLTQNGHPFRPRASRRYGALTFLLTCLQPFALGLGPFLKDQPIKTATKKHPYIPQLGESRERQARPHRSETPALPNQPVDEVFFDALKQAGLCRRHSSWSKARLASRRLVHTSSSDCSFDLARNGRKIRRIHSSTWSRRPSNQSLLTREECLSLVDLYSEHYSTQSRPLDLVPTDHVPDGRSSPPTQSLDNDHSLSEAGTYAIVEPSKSHVQDLIAVLEDANCTHDEAWDAYRRLSSPGVALLSEKLRRRLLQCLAIIERKEQESMFRYMSVVDDMAAIGSPLDRSEWNTAIAFIGHGFPRICSASVESALLKWKEMENKAHVKSGHVTFNILFDLATKAEKYGLADMVLNEMESRGLKLNRFAHVGLIYYHGRRGNGESVRRAYRHLVEAGEIVDTVVLNCVIASLIRAGEFAAAEHVFEGMKDNLAKYSGRQVPNLDWKECRDLGRQLDRAAVRFKEKPEERQRVQEQQFLAPNRNTFAILVHHHVIKTGELRRIASLVTDMQHLGVPMDGRIFVRIFKGFAFHGGKRYTAWTKTRLDSVWTALLRILDQQLDFVRLDKWLIVWTVRAFEKCFGPEQTLLIWEELRKRWKSDYRDLSTVQGILQDTLARAVDHAYKSPTTV